MHTNYHLLLFSSALNAINLKTSVGSLRVFLFSASFILIFFAAACFLESSAPPFSCFCSWLLLCNLDDVDDNNSSMHFAIVRAASDAACRLLLDSLLLLLSLSCCSSPPSFFFSPPLFSNNNNRSKVDAYSSGDNGEVEPLYSELVILSTLAPTSLRISSNISFLTCSLNATRIFEGDKLYNVLSSSSFCFKSNFFLLSSSNANFSDSFLF